MLAFFSLLLINSQLGFVNSKNITKSTYSFSLPIQRGRSSLKGKYKFKENDIEETANGFFSDGDMVVITLNGCLYGKTAHIVGRATINGDFRVLLQGSNESPLINIVNLRKLPRILIHPIQPNDCLKIMDSIQLLSHNISEKQSMILLPMEKTDYISSNFLYLNGYFGDNYDIIKVSTDLLRVLQNIQSRTIKMESKLEIDVNKNKIINVIMMFMQNCDPLLVIQSFELISSSTEKSFQQNDIIFELLKIYHEKEQDMYRPYLLQTRQEWNAKYLKFVKLFNKWIYTCFDVVAFIEIVQHVLQMIERASQIAQKGFTFSNIEDMGIQQRYITELDNIINMIEQCFNGRMHCSYVRIYAYSKWIPDISNGLILHYAEKGLNHGNGYIQIVNI